MLQKVEDMNQAKYDKLLRGRPEDPLALFPRKGEMHQMVIAACNND